MVPIRIIRIEYSLAITQFKKKLPEPQIFNVKEEKKPPQKPELMSLSYSPCCLCAPAGLRECVSQVRGHAAEGIWLPRPLFLRRDVWEWLRGEVIYLYLLPAHSGDLCTIEKVDSEWHLVACKWHKVTFEMRFIMMFFLTDSRGFLSPHSSNVWQCQLTILHFWAV